MAESNTLAEKKVITADGVVTATVVDRVSPDHMADLLVRGSTAAKYARTEDETPLVSRDIRDLLVFPISEV
jgi:hypothetical protein